MWLSPSDLQALWLTLRLAAIVTLLLVVLGTPLAWWLAQGKSGWRGPVGAVVALPLVLPPSVLGFYLLLAMGPQGPLGKLTASLGLPALPFSFSGLLIASLLYSLPFMVQPLRSTFEGLDLNLHEAAATLRATPLDTFLTVTLPLSRHGYFTACVMTFAHTLGEFGVVLMVGGNIPGLTRVASIHIYDQVQALDYAAAHRLSAVMLVLSFVMLWLVSLHRGQQKSVV